MFSMQSSNPVLQNRNLPRSTGGKTMTMNGAVNKSIILGGLVLLTALIVGQLADPATYSGWAMGGAIGGLIFGLVTSFKPEWAPVTAPIYAVCEGALLAVVTMIAELSYPGVALNAVFLTIGTLLSMLMAWKAGWIQVTDKLRSGIVMATGGIFIVYLISFVASLFGAPMSFLHDSSPISIGISLVVIVVASLSLLLDFEMIEEVSQRRAPEYMEWYAAFALMVTLIWLYLEFLKLLMKLQRRD